MKEKISIFIILLLYIGFLAFHYINANNKLVLKVVTPTIIQIDINNNRKLDENETICIPGVSSYTSNLQYYINEIESISSEDGLAIGYLADEFANSQLAYKKVKLKYNGIKRPKCTEAEIIVENKKYSDILKSSGFAILGGKEVNEDAFTKIKSKAKRLNLSIYNHTSNKYHKLNCKYGKIAHDAVVLPEKELPKDATPCKFCYIKPTNKNKLKAKIILPPPTILSSGNLKVILTDYTQVLKPDSSCNHTVCKEFLSLVDNTNETLDIALYGWTEIPKVKKALKCADSRGVKIRIIYDTQSSKDNYYPDTENLIMEFKNTKSDDIGGKKSLTNALMHNKFAISDQKKVFTGSMNFSKTGFSGFNQNNILIINSAEIADIYIKEFEQMYSGKFHNLKETPNQNSIKKLSDSNIKIYFSPQDKSITKRVIPLVNSAKKNIYIPAFLITHKELTTALINSHKRGVNVKIILDATNTSVRHSTVKELKNAGIPVKVENYAGKLHSKVIIIDAKYVITGSTNFSNSGENKNDENMIIIENPKIANFYSDYFEYLWKKIPDKYLKFNPPAESKYSIGSCADGIDNDFDGKIDKDDEGCK